MTRDARVISFQAGRGQRRCPNCGGDTAKEFRPFCSKRCADIDLGRWLKESYRIPTDERPGTADDLPDESD